MATKMLNEQGLEDGVVDRRVWLGLGEEDFDDKTAIDVALKGYDDHFDSVNKSSGSNKSRLASKLHLVLEEVYGEHNVGKELKTVIGL